MRILLSCGHSRVVKAFYIFFGTDRIACLEPRCWYVAIHNQHPLIKAATSP